MPFGNLAIAISRAPWVCDFDQLPTVLPFLIRGFPLQVWFHRLLCGALCNAQMPSIRLAPFITTLERLFPNLAACATMHTTPLCRFITGESLLRLLHKH
jgi:hypothetical protein